MRTRFLFLLVLAAATLLTNVVRSANIAHGVEVVVIDAGHGGKFPGAHYGGVYEKDLTLKVALKVGRLIEQGMPGVKVVYTRKTDKELGKTLADDLQARADIANGAGGDLFISIHVNAARATAARGVETLIMGESPKEQRYNENALYESNREDLIDMSTSGPRRSSGPTSRTCSSPTASTAWRWPASYRTTTSPAAVTRAG